MKTIMIYLMATLFVSSEALAQAKKPAPATAAKGTVILKKISTTEDYLNYVDLERVYLDANGGGSPAIFIAVPSQKTAKAVKKETVIAYYQKTQTNLAVIGYVEAKYDKDGNYLQPTQLEQMLVPSSYRPWDDLTPAKPDTGTGDHYSCVQDNYVDVAKMDVAAINATALKEVEAISKIPEAQRSESQKAAYLALPDTDLAILNTNDSAKIEKARLAFNKLNVLKNGLRAIPIPRGGVQTNCQKIKNELQQNIGQAILPVMIPAESQQNSDMDVYAIWYNAFEKDVSVNGKVVSAVVDAKGNMVKADGLDLQSMNEEYGSHNIFVKQPLSAVKNAETLVSLYKDLGYTYTAAPSSANTGYPPAVPSEKFCGLVKKDAMGLTAVQDNRFDVRIYPKGTLIPIAKLSPQDLGVYTQISDADLKAITAAECGCISGIKTEYYRDGTEENEYNDYVSISYMFSVDSVEVKKLSACSKIDGKQELSGAMYEEDGD